MKKFTIMVIPDGRSSITKQYQLPSVLLKLAVFSGIFISGVTGYVFLDYLQLKSIKAKYQALTTESEGIKGEAKILMSSLEDVKLSLRRVQDYTSKLGELTALKIQTVSQKTGIGPLSEEDMAKKLQHAVPPTLQTPESHVPLGLEIDKLAFKPIFHRLTSIGEDANRHAFELQHLLSTLSQQKSLLASIPMMKPVNGWMTSSYGTRISPFTGEKSHHQGIDLAASVGTPIYAPADGTVIFSGAKAGFGNFIMIAHGYGVVTRYGHNHQNLVQPGQGVKRGEQIGTVGATGRTTGPHLHYEIWVNGRTENPKKFVLDDPQMY